MKRRVQLDGLRGVAALMVFSYHAFMVPLQWCGVDLFFVLSGYLITGILLRRKEELGSAGAVLKDFYSRRAFRILPPFLLFILVICLVYHQEWKHILWGYGLFNANFTLVFSHWGASTRSLIPLWSLAVEEHFYFVWPLVVLMCSTKTLKRVCLGVIVMAPMLRMIATPLPFGHELVYFFAPFRMDTLAYGAAIAIFEYEDRTCLETYHRKAGICAVAALTVLCALSASPAFRLGANTIFFNGLGFSLIALMFGGLIFYALGTHRGPDYSLMTLKPLCYLSPISYTFYLYHSFILIQLERHFSSTIINAALSFVIAGVIAAVSWHFFETPILRMRSKVVVKKRVAPAFRSVESMRPLGTVINVARDDITARPISSELKTSD